MSLSISSIGNQIPGYSDAQIRRIAGPSVTPMEESALRSGQPGKVNKAECQTCKERKYQDGSDENVSFKSAAHISPNAAGAAVRAHEGEHVSNAYKKAAMEGGKVIHAGVSIHTAVCPECGRTYVSGGVTNTTLALPKDGKENPYKANAKSILNDIGVGAKANYAV